MVFPIVQFKFQLTITDFNRFFTFLSWLTFNIINCDFSSTNEWDDRQAWKYFNCVWNIDLPCWRKCIYPWNLGQKWSKNAKGYFGRIADLGYTPKCNGTSAVVAENSMLLTFVKYFRSYRSKKPWIFIGNLLEKLHLPSWKKYDVPIWHNS